MATLGDGDAVLNIQADGTVHLADGVTAGNFTSGDVIDLSSPIDVSLTLPAIGQPQTTTLGFDLIGFGEDNSSANVSSLSFQNDQTLSWHNARNPLDVDGNGSVEPLDVLLVINELRGEFRHDSITKIMVAITDEVSPPPYLDVTGDNQMSPLDALLVINHLRQQQFDLEAPWNNDRDPLDVDDNGEIEPLDSLLLINELRSPTHHDPETGILELPADPTTAPPPYYDVTGNNRLEPLDVLQVINHLRANPPEPEPIIPAVVDDVFKDFE